MTTAKAVHFQKLIEESNHSLMTWKAINKILRKGEQTCNSFPTRLNVKGKTLSYSSEICHELNQYFCSIGHEMAKDIVPRYKSPFSESF